MHEIGHLIGLWHEQSRSDYADHIEIKWENIDESDHDQFEQPIQNARDVGEYDYTSIMHYPEHAFSNNGCVTIVTKNGEPIGQRNGLSSGDINACRHIYPGLDWG